MNASHQYRPPYILHAMLIPFLIADGSLPVPVPVTREHITEISQLAELTPFGRGDQASVDNHTWQLEPEQFEVRNPGVVGREGDDGWL